MITHRIPKDSRRHPGLTSGLILSVTVVAFLWLGVTTVVLPSIAAEPCRGHRTRRALTVARVPARG